MPNQNKKYKIALVGSSLGVGGSEKVQARLSIFFESRNIEVHHIIFKDNVTFDYSGKILNLGLMKSKTFFDKLNQLYAMRIYFRKNKFDYVIDSRGRSNLKNELLIKHYVCNCPIIYMVHSGIIDSYITNNKYSAKLIYSKSKIVTVSKAIRDRIIENYGFNTNSIYNPFDLKSIQNLGSEFVPEEKNYIVAVGRLNDKVKQFDKLIDTYSKSELPQKNIKLLILAEGIYENELINQVENLNLSNKIIFKGFQNNPYPYLKNAIFTVLSSLNEGLPNVLIESLASGTPVISFNCFSGPNEIITNEINGLLVENQNVEKLTEAMNRLINDIKLYQNCKDNAFESIQKFSVDNIGQQWLDLMEIKKI
jgi:glycosyltransferase involved in cell wall biosynthesis